MVKFQDPPKTTGGRGSRGKHLEIASELRGRPGEWALVMEGVAGSSPTMIRTGAIRAYTPAGAFDATARKRPDGKFDVYARFVGEVSR